MAEHHGLLRPVQVSEHAGQFFPNWAQILVLHVWTVAYVAHANYGLLIDGMAPIPKLDRRSADLWPRQ